MFKPVGSRVSFPALEEEVLRFWKERDIFHRTEVEREGGPRFMLYEGPPTANGSPGIHHVLARIFKDVIPRYKTMKGYRCIRKGGWDTHGLPVELEIEKKLGISTKREIENIVPGDAEASIRRFNELCRASVMEYVDEWEKLTDRIAFWVDMKDAYVTFHNDYIETGWWILKKLWDRGLLYQGYKVTPHCPRCVTSLSSHEVALGYKEDTPDPSVFVRFRLAGHDGSVGARAAYNGLVSHGQPVYFLAWTTTPWTLTANAALAVAPNEEYVLAESPDGAERLVLAKARVEVVLKDGWSTLATVKGADLDGILYEPLYRTGPSDYAHRVVPANYVSMEDGTGIVHTAPAYGADDQELGRAQNLPTIHTVDLQGHIVASLDVPGAGKFVKQADREIMADLERRGLLYRRETIRHTYPFCWRCDSPLLYYAKTSWYIRTTAVKDGLISGNQRINWYPGHIQEGRFGEWLRSNIDWAISRERYWGTPLPIWHCESCNEHDCFGSVAELKARALSQSQALLDGKLDLHRPDIDHVLVKCQKCGGTMRRLLDVLDCWFDSGAMPFAQAHVMSDADLARLRQQGLFPADYICEAIDQTRGWFYTLHALATLVAGEPSYRNVICLGLVLDEKGEKMSKSRGNMVRPWDVITKHGSDAIRWYMVTASPPGEPRRFSSSLVEEVVRRFMLTLWNTYSFFVTYANLDNWQPTQAEGVAPQAELDRWVLSELNLLVSDVDEHLSGYNPTAAGRRIEEFVELLSNWYVRRSRRRFWKSENDQDKLQAYATLYRCLTTVAKLIAPLMPFVAEEMYRNLVASQDPNAPESVHLSRFPEPDQTLIDQRLMEATRLAMRIASLGRAARASAGIRVRQPLAKVSVALRAPEEAVLVDSVREQVLDELNVKDIVVVATSEIDASQKAAAAEGGYAVALDTHITPALADEGLARELVHRIQNMRKSAGFELMDRIVTTYQAGAIVRRVMDSHGDYIRQETLSESLRESPPDEGAYQEKFKLSGEEVALGVRRVG